MRIALGLEYDGATFCGWQTQPDGCAVQDALEAALSKIACEEIGVICAGRTDAGVHALCQVVHFDCEVSRPSDAWTRGVNSVLSPGVSVLWEKQVSPEFHARYSATSRCYKYFLLNRRHRPGLMSKHVGWCDKSLDADAMNEAAKLLVGNHDFSAFRASQCQAHSPVRTIFELGVSRHRDIICFEITANAFLQHMVRNIVGSLVYVGIGRERAAWIDELLESRDRQRAAPTFAASGLYLSNVSYEDHWQLPDLVKSALPAALFG